VVSSALSLQKIRGEREEGIQWDMTNIFFNGNGPEGTGLREGKGKGRTVRFLALA
jgi:hypothetical protein